MARWSARRRRTLAGLGAAAVVAGLGGWLLPDEAGVASASVAALCAFLLVAALIVFVAVPGPGTLGTLLGSTTLAGAVLVVAVLLLLAAPADLRPLWWAGVATGAAWLGWALWTARGGTPDG